MKGVKDTENKEVILFIIYLINENPLKKKQKAPSNAPLNAPLSSPGRALLVVTIEHSIQGVHKKLARPAHPPSLFKGYCNV